MKKIIVALVLFIALASVYIYATNPKTATRQKTIIVGPTTVICANNSTQRCLQIKNKASDNWQNYYGAISGYHHVMGTEANLVVEEKLVKADGTKSNPSQLSLVKVIVETQVPYVYISDPVDLATLPVDQPITLTGRGRGLFADNVIIQAGGTQNILAQTATTLATAEPGGEGSWTATLSVHSGTDIQGTLSAYSPSPVAGEPGLRYTIPVTYSAVSEQ